MSVFTIQSLEILFEDQHLVVLSKPAGLLSQGDVTETESLVDLLRVHFGRHYVGLVHRLDRNTSGLMVVAKRSKAANRLTESLQNGSLKRAYLAWVQGELTGSGTWRHLLLKDEATNTVKVVKSKVSGAKEAVLNWESKGVHSLSGQKISLIQLVLETGRSHQIRVQASAEGHPLLGDLKYGGNSFGNLVTRTALHSSDLEFPHPMSGEKMKFHVPFPKADDPI